MKLKELAVSFLLHITLPLVNYVIYHTKFYKNKTCLTSLKIYSLFSSQFYVCGSSSVLLSSFIIFQFLLLCYLDFEQKSVFIPFNLLFNAQRKKMSFEF